MTSPAKASTPPVTTFVRMGLTCDYDVTRLSQEGFTDSCLQRFSVPRPHVHSNIYAIIVLLLYCMLLINL